MLCSPASTPPPKYTFRHRRRAHYPPSPPFLVPDSPISTPRFSRLLGTALGSPFLTTSDLPLPPPPDLAILDRPLPPAPHSFTVDRPSSPTPSGSIDTFSIISPSEVPDVFSSRNYPCPSTPQSSLFFSRSPSRGMWPMLYFTPPLGTALVDASHSPSPNPFKSLFPKIWDALSSPGKHTLTKPQLSSSGRNGKGKMSASLDLFHSDFNYQDLPPLDGEEGELIDDEACFIDVRAVTGIDILSLLPPELSLYILSTFLDLSSVLSCLAVSRRWRTLARDNGVWRALFLAEAGKDGRGWGIDLSRAALPTIQNGLTHLRCQWNRNSIPPGGVSIGRFVSTSMRRSCSAPSTANLSLTPSQSTSYARASLLHDRSLSLPPTLAPLTLDWRLLFKERLELDKRWVNGDPEVRRIEGHADSVYCLEFDATRIITGSRDKTIKVWSLATGRLLGTLRGHAGSVLCLKFDKDWEGDDDNEESDLGCDSELRARDDVTVKRVSKALSRRRSGFMVSGSSDCSVCVWDLYDSDPDHRESGVPGDEVRGEVRAALKGHSGGVLDLRIDKRWIVSCSKDALIRVWDRRTLELHRTLRGHEGPVNAVGLQSGGNGTTEFDTRGGRVVSASGDGKMMLWDIESGERLRTFEGHDRGLACIEFKDDLIVSGSNDCKIKVWSASTGECIRTLVGHDLLVRALSFDPKSGRLVSASYDKSVKVWDLRSGKMIREFRNSHSSHIFDVKFDVGRIVSTSHDQKIVILDFTKGINATLFV